MKLPGSEKLTARHHIVRGFARSFFGLNISNPRGNEDQEMNNFRSNDYATPDSNDGEGFWELRLYVAGQTPNSLKAFSNLKKICEEHLAGRYRIEIIDLLVNPQLAKKRPNSGDPDPGQKTARAGA